jgi:hypothetical protein
MEESDADHFIPLPIGKPARHMTDAGSTKSDPLSSCCFEAGAGPDPCVAPAQLLSGPSSLRMNNTLLLSHLQRCDSNVRILHIVLNDAAAC